MRQSCLEYKLSGGSVGWLLLLPLFFNFRGRAISCCCCCCCCCHHCIAVAIAIAIAVAAVIALVARLLGLSSA